MWDAAHQSGYGGGVSKGGDGLDLQDESTV
jgi:hypothetical protein